MATELTSLRSRIPGNRALRQKAICLQEAAKYRKRGDKKRAANALSRAESFQREHDEYESSETLIHFRPVPEGVCERKDSNVDERVKRDPVTGTTITYMASASHLANVTCLLCRRWARKNPRKSWRCEHGVLLRALCSKCEAEFEEFLSSVAAGEAKR